MRKMISGTAAALLMASLLAVPLLSVAQEAEQKSNLSDLLKQRRDTLRQLVELVNEQYLVGEGSFDSVIQAKQRLLDAELELANSRQQRLALLQQQVKMLESFSAATDQRFQLGHVRQTERLAARVAVLNAKISLVREQDVGGEVAK